MTQEVTWADLLQLVDDTLADVDAPTLDNLWNPIRQLFSFAQYHLPEDAADLEVAVWSSAYAELLYKARKTLYAFFYSLALVADIDEETEGDFFDLVEQYLPHPYKSDTVGKYDPVGLLDRRQGPKHTRTSPLGTDRDLSSPCYRPGAIARRRPE